jgi:cyanate lyase
LAILPFLTYNLRQIIEVVKFLGKTIRQLSEELQLSKQAINQRISSIKDFRSEHTHKVKNHLEIDEQGVKMLANFDKQKRQDQQADRQTRQAENDKQDKNKTNINNVLLKQLDVKDQQIANLQQALDQQQQLQLTTLAENRQLKEHLRKLGGLLKSSSLTEERQAAKKSDNLSNDANPIHTKDKNDKQDKDRVDDTDENQKKIHKNKTNKSWWHFW